MPTEHDSNGPDLRIASIEIIPVKIPLREPFVISYATYPDVLSVIVKITTRDGTVGWGEATPDPNVTGESWTSTAATLRDDLAPALIGHDARNRETAIHAIDARVEGVPTAKAVSISPSTISSDAPTASRSGALLGGRSKPHLTISRVVGLKTPEEMARDATQHVADGFTTVKAKVGDRTNWRHDVARIAAVREAIGPEIGLKIDVNQGWKTAGVAIQAIRASLSRHPRLHRTTDRLVGPRRPRRRPPPNRRHDHDRRRLSRPTRNPTRRFPSRRRSRQHQTTFPNSSLETLSTASLSNVFCQMMPL